MSWPMSQDFNEAMQNPRISFDDPDLKTGETVVGAHGMPLPRSGNFADVYQLCGTDGREWAIKCFTRPVTGLGDRYAAISEALAEASFPFTVGFEFLAEGIRVAGVGRPIVKMEWVEGLLLNQVVRENAEKPGVLNVLGQLWARVCKRLREAGVAHADLQHGNVLLVPGSRPGAFGLKLIDYDGMYVPALANTPSGESGHPSYQHPARAATRAYSPDVDRFPQLVIATALKALTVWPDLWSRYDNGDNLLFTEEDFRDPAKSRLMREMWLTEDRGLQAFVGRLAIACVRPIPQTPWLDQFAPDGDPVPLSDVARRQAAAVLGVESVVPAVVEPEPELVEVDVQPEPQAPRPTETRRVRDEEFNLPPRRRKRAKREQRGHRGWVVFASMAVVALVGAVVIIKFQSPSNRASKEVAGIEPGQTDVAPAPIKTNPPVNIDTPAIRHIYYPLSPTLSTAFCQIPSGRSRLGSPSGEAKRSPLESEREFSTNGFWLGKFEVTQAEWIAVMGSNPSVHNGRNAGPLRGLDTFRFPVENVCWNDLQQFLRALNDHSKVKEAFGVPGVFSLPTDDEWEYACRGGKGNANPFYFGSVLDGRQANSDGSKPYGGLTSGPNLGRTTTVGSYASEFSHPWGLCDLHGNVYEFCESDQPRPPGTRVLKGGSYGDSEGCRAANRNFFGPDTNRYHNVGFRVCFRVKDPGSKTVPVEPPKPQNTPPEEPPVDPPIKDPGKKDPDKNELPEPAATMLDLPPSAKLLTFTPASSKPDSALAPKDSHILFEAPVYKIKRIFAPEKRTEQDVVVVWQAVAGANGKGEKLNVDIHSGKKRGARVSRIEIDGDGNEAKCDLSPDGKSFVAVGPDGKLTIWSLSDQAPAKVLENYDPYADRPDLKAHGIAGVFFTKAPGRLLTVTTAGAAQLIDPMAKKVIERWSPLNAKLVPNKVVLGKNLAVDDAHSSIVIAVGGGVYQIESTTMKISWKLEVGEVGRHLGIGVLGVPGRIVYAFETNNNGKKERAILFSLSTDKAPTVYRWPDAAGDPSEAMWVDVTLAVVGAEKGVVYFSGEGFKPLGFAESTTKVSNDANENGHWFTTPDPTGAAMRTLLQQFATDDLMDYLRKPVEGAKDPPTSKLSGRGLVK